MNYLIDMPQIIENYGLCKTLIIRRETIHYKHIFTEIFLRKSIDIEDMLNKLNMTLFDFMSYSTQRMRRIHHFSREYKADVNMISKCSEQRIFPLISLYKGLNNIIILDFDGVMTDKSFYELYELCIKRCKVIICSANPKIEETWFEKHNLSKPDKIFSCKGKYRKINKIKELSLSYDNSFYIDDEEEYLKFAWIFGIKTYSYKKGKIMPFSLCTK